MILEILYYLTIRPLEILFETIFFMSYKFIGKPFATIIALSIFVNILVFPLYKRADKLQAQQRAREKAMEDRLEHIRKTFKGDEKVMMTQAYYRICDYKPVYALRGASSLLLQIPFFISAYRFLSGLELIKGMPSILLNLPWNGGVPSYLIKDLGAPDAMLFVSGHFINVLPILMTLINIVSGTIYSKGHLRKEKIQLYVTALVFLVLLYNSPSGLVIYWTCNNIFSLGKNAFQKLFEKVRAGNVSGSEASAEEKSAGASSSVKIYGRIFFVCALLMALITGLFIPSNVISSAATEFISQVDVFNPSRYLVYSFSIALGFFVIWLGIYFLFSTPKVQKVFACVMAVFCVCSVINYMMSGSGLGTLSADLKYDNSPVFASSSVILNLALIVGAAVVLIVIFRIKPEITLSLAMAGTAALICVSGMNIFKINRGYSEYADLYFSSDAYKEMPKVRLSEDGKNVVVILLDRAMSPQLLYMLYERPDLLEMYDGFTFYHDTVSFGGFTNFGMPPVFGGYEYTPAEMNKRDGELLKDKTNEALKVLPVLFYENGYDVTVFDPPYANYNYDSDLSIYDDYPGINGYVSCGKFANVSEEGLSASGESRKRNLFCFGNMKAFPLLFQSALYDNGNYNGSGSVMKSSGAVFDPESDEAKSGKISEGYGETFYSWYSVLDNLKNITEITDNEKGEFLMMYNCTSHEPEVLQLPDYRPQMYVDNTSYDVDRFYDLNGVKINMDDRYHVRYYHVNMAALLRIGEWLDYLKAEGVYDNTRIIITSDHGRGVGWFDNFTFGDQISTEWYLPLLLVKDFDAHGFNVSTDFMTNADACVMAVSGDVVEEAVNPFTGNPLDGHQKFTDPVLVTTNEDYNIYEFHGYKFTPGDWYSVSGSPYIRENWQYVGYE